MIIIKRIFFFLFFSSIFIFNGYAQDLKINELMSTNSNTIYDEDNDSPDWIEIVNNGNTTVNLADFYISDDSEDLLKWQFPEINLAPSQQFLVFASDKDRRQIPLHWNSVVDLGDTWRYILPNSEVSSTWKQTGFNDLSWKTGQSGIGYGDDDDITQIPNGTMSVFMRYKFDLNDLESISSLWFHMDFDDGFVAYLNNTEIARSGLGLAGSTVSYNKAAASHEALIYQGQNPESYDISEWVHLLKGTDNVLAVQVHNTGTNSSDLTAIPILTIGSKNNQSGATISEHVTLPTLYPHANFKLSSTGETIYLSNKNGSIIDSVKFDIIPSAFSYGRDISETDKWGYFAEPTPGLPNSNEILTDVVKGEVKFSISDMFLTSSQYLSLSGAASGEEIRFTENGEEPTENSYKSQFGILIDKNKVIRARIFKAGAIPGKISSRTYLFDEKPTLPVVSVVTDPENLWNNETGIYVLGDDYENQNPYYGANFWEDWEKPANVEMMDTDGNLLFSMNCGIKIFGAWSRARDQKSISVFFRKEYGDPVLKDVQLFKAKPITEFYSFILRNSGNDYDYTRFRDGMMTDLVSKMDNDIQAFQATIMYLNGEYWGHINMREKLNEEYLESNYGVNADKVDILEQNGNIVDGSNESYWELINFLESNNMSADANYEFAASQIDISNFIDYMLSEIYFNNRDWPGNNSKYWRPQAEGGKWRWLMYDTDFGFGLYNGQDYELNTLDFATATNGPDWPNPPWSTLILRKLLENQQFRFAFINRFADMMNSTFIPNSVIEKIDSIASILEPEITNHAGRWWVPSKARWEQTTETMRNFARNRTPYVRSHIKQKFGIPEDHVVRIVSVPSFAGSVELNTIHITDPIWNGQYFQNVPIKLTAHSYKGFKFHSWKVNGVVMMEETIELNVQKTTVIQAIYEESEDDGKTIVINEINYNSADDSDAGDWIELYNWGKSDIDMSGWIVRDNNDVHSFVLPENTILNSKDYLVLCRSSEDFQVIHPDVLNFTGDFDFGLGSAGDAVRLFDEVGILIDSLTFGSELPWPTEPNGNGPTLELRNYTYNNSDAASWNASLVNMGTPGKENSITSGVNLFAGNYTQKELNIYPNPFATETRIAIENGEFDGMNIQIYSMDGRLVCNENSADNEFVWRGENSAGQKLQPGIYICKVKSGKEIFTKKLILSN